MTNDIAKYQLKKKRTAGSGLFYYMTEEQEGIFRELFPVHTNRQLAEWFGIGMTTVKRFAREMALSKDMEECRRIGGIKYKETWRKERLRTKYGQERKTNLHVPAQNMRRKAVVQKYVMIHECNYFAVKGHPMWVCYDYETRRSKRREETAEKLGLKIIDGQ